MPWCHTCDRFYNPNTLRADGTCPVCAQAVAEPAPDGETAEAHVGAPWHFKLVVGAAVVYLGWRAVEGIVWVGQHL